MEKKNFEEQIIRTEYSEIMQKSYIDYAMSVIIARALPDVRDGLKPVQRRTLYDMYELGIRYDKPFRKSARIVGDTMGKYHPHGDSSIYDALVVMSQDFKKGEPLVDGHGNFGSIEGDGAAAMRYTEARLQKLTQEAFLTDLDKNVVDFQPNFDETEKEPEVLPAKIPNLLINGAEGIAVGMATSIPPHNTGEVIDAVLAYIKNNHITTEELLSILPGPDFPTGGIVTNKSELLSIYETGQGKIKLRGKVDIEKNQRRPGTACHHRNPLHHDRRRNRQIFKRCLCPCGKQKNNRYRGYFQPVFKRRDTNCSGTAPWRRCGKNLKNMLYKKTRLEDTFGVNMLAVADGRPETMGLKAIIESFLDFQYDINTRKYQHLLMKEREKQEIQEGLMKACDVIDLIIEILQGSKISNRPKPVLSMV